MKISFTLLAILVTLSVIIPFLIFVLKGLNTSTKKEVEKLTKQNNLKYGYKEVWNNKFIGITEDNTILTYIHLKAEDKQHENVELSEIKNCELVTNYKSDKSKMNQLIRLDLRLTYKLANKTELVINFFDTDEMYMENYEMNRVKNWKDLISNKLHNSEALKKAS
ncbi:hypothetical protein AAFN75_05725 [Algibacter sp. AS12]|uniref:hypothetical protein n=1 Tax=Algibacter sp. AS12 TaxID=3135773 RepID=UPI00398B28F5